MEKVRRLILGELHDILTELKLGNYVGHTIRYYEGTAVIFAPNILQSCHYMAFSVPGCRVCESL